MSLSSHFVQLPRLRLLAAAVMSAVLAVTSLTVNATVTTGGMSVPRMLHQANTLADGRVLVSGGYARPGATPYASTELFEPVTGVFTPAAPMLQARVNHGAVTLADGRVLVVGGSIATSPGLVGTASAELYDAASGQWTSTGSMSVARWRAMARLLPDGRVLVMNSDRSNPFAEVYDPQTGAFTRTGNVLEATNSHGLVVLADGRVLKVGGYSSAYSKRAEIWDPATNTWSATGSMASARQDIRPILLPDGKVLVAGGRNEANLNSAEIFDPVTGLFTAAGAMPEALQIDTSISLSDGSVLLAGPYSTSLLRYQPGPGVWNLTGPKRAAVRDSAIVALANGNLLLSGGSPFNDSTGYAAVWDLACAPQKIALSTPSQSLSGDGGPLAWNVSAAPGCRFEIADLPAWLAPADGAVQQMAAGGSMPVTVSAAANTTGATRNASFLLGNSTASVSQVSSPACPAVPSITPGSFNFSSGATSGSMSISAAQACPWTIASLPSWVTPTSGTSGTGNGSVPFAVAANTGPARSGSGQLTALGQSKTFTMSQDAPPLCPTAPVVTPNSLALTAAASNGSISVSAAAGCPWSVAAPGWIGIGGASGTGNGSFTYTVGANGGALRSGSVVVSGPGVASSVSVSQAAGACASWTISPASNTFGSGASSGTLTVSAAGECSWNLSALPGWMALTTLASGTGSGSIGYSVAANAGPARSATASLSGSGPALSLRFDQAAPVSGGCVVPISFGAPVNGFLKAAGCATGARGSGYHTDRYTFNGTPGQRISIALSSPSFDTYLFLRSPSGTVLTSNDDGGGGTNSRIPATSGSYTLPATGGVYTIEVTSYGAGAGGAYTVSLAP